MFQFLRSLSYLPSQLHEAEERISRRLHDVRVDLANLLNRTEHVPEPALTYVYVLPSDASAMLADSVAVSPGLTYRLTFQPVLPVPANSWIVVVGPATLVSASVGPDVLYQLPSSSGQVARLTRPTELGVLIGVTLQGRSGGARPTALAPR